MLDRITTININHCPCGELGLCVKDSIEVIGIKQGKKYFVRRPYQCKSLSGIPQDKLWEDIRLNIDDWHAACGESL